MKDTLNSSFQVSEKEIVRILNSTHDGLIAINKEGVVTLFNSAAKRITGFDKEKVIGKKAEDVIPNTRLPAILNSGIPEYNRKQALNETTTIITNRVPVFDDAGKITGAVAVFRDITEIISLAEEVTNLKEIETLLKAIINSTQDAISVVDEHGKGIMINPAYTELTGLTENDVIGKPATVDIAEGESMHYRVLKSRQPVKGKQLKVGPNKREVVVDVAPIIVNGKLKGSVGVIHDVSKIKQLTRELDEAKSIIRKLEAKYTFDDIVGSSEKLNTTVKLAKTAAETPATVLLRGESGTGKELFAHAIHNASERRFNPFIRVNCAALPENLLESELFGYEEGAFTGAKKGGKKGLFEQAKNGSIFLDEIGEMSLRLQVKLLRVLQEWEFVRVGGHRSVPVNCRVIAATNKDLEKAIANQGFRKDLYYRLNVIPIYITPIRERPEDIPELTYYLIRKFNQEYGRNVTSISKAAIERLKEYNWPGNVRELENYIGRAMINLDIKETEILLTHFPYFPIEREFGQETIEQKSHIRTLNHLTNANSLKEAMDNIEKDIILSKLNTNNGNRQKTAEDLGIGLRTLQYKISKYGLKK